MPEEEALRRFTMNVAHLCVGTGVICVGRRFQAICHKLCIGTGRPNSVFWESYGWKIEQGIGC